MNFQIKNFFDYLYYIGVTSEDTSPIMTKLFSDKYNDFNKSSTDIDNLLTSLMCEYLKLLKEDQLILIGKNIYQQFSKNKLMAKMKHLKKVMHIKELYNKRILKRHFNKWRLCAIHLMTFNDNNKPILYGKNEYCNNNINNFKEKKNSYSVASLNINNFLNKLDFYDSIRIKKKIKIKKLNDDDIINNCTFSPNLHLTKERNKRFLSNNNEESNIKRLYNKENIYKLLYDDYKTKDKAIEELSKKIYDDKFTFSPRINTNNEYIKKIQDNFFERNQKMINRKKELYGIFVENQNLNKIPSSRHKFLKKSLSTKKI